MELIGMAEHISYLAAKLIEANKDFARAMKLANDATELCGKLVAQRDDAIGQRDELRRELEALRHGK